MNHNMFAYLEYTTRLFKNDFTGVDGVFSWIWMLTFFLLIAFFYFCKTSYKKSLTALLKFTFPKSIYFSRSSLVDLFLFIGNNFIYAACAIFLIPIHKVEFVTSWIKKVFPEYLATHLGHDHFIVANGLVVNLFYTLCVYLAYETAFYFMHVALHKVPFLWELHKVHHSSTVLTPLTGGARVHPLEQMVGTLSFGISAGLTMALFNYGFKIPPSNFMVAEIALFDIIRKAIGNLTHFHVVIDIGPLKYFYMLPGAHLVHHSKQPEHFNKNFGIALPWWDMLLGTYYEPKEGETFEFGCGGNVDWNSLPLWRYYWDPVVNSLRTLVKMKISTKAELEINNENLPKSA